MTISLAQYAEQKRDEAGESTIPSAIRKRWQERIVANGWHEMGKDGAAKYLAKYGQNIGAPKVVQLARQAEAGGCPEVALGFWRKAYELEHGHTPPADDVNDKPETVSVPSLLTTSDIRKMEAGKDIAGLTKALYYKFPYGHTARTSRSASEVRSAAANALAKIDVVLATKALIEALKAGDEDVRASAARGPLGRIGGTQAVDALIEALKDSAGDVKQNAAHALERLGDVRAVAPLMEALKDTYGPMRGSAAWALGKLGDVRAVDALIETLKDDHKGARQEAARALGKLGDARAVGALIEALKDDVGDVRGTAAGALGQLGDVQAVDVLIETLKDDNRLARWVAAQSLGQLGDVRAVDALIEALKDDDRDVRRHAALTLGRLGDVRAVDALTNARRDRDERVRSGAASALKQIGDVQTLEEITRRGIGGVSEAGIGFDLPPQLEKFRSNIEATVKPYIEIRYTIAEKGTSLWQSKFGGLPYLPKDIPYPTGLSGRPLFLLAQINFAQVPRLEPFPEEGILQFYIADDGRYGEDYADPMTQEGFRILFFPQVGADEEKLVTDFHFLPERIYFPVSGSRSLTFVQRYEPISGQDYRFEAAVFGEDIPQPRKRVSELKREYGDMFFARDSKIGGYPAFPQDDPRAGRHKEKGYDVLLLQIGAGEWGENGWADFFIREEDLQKRDFSQVMYTWQSF